jgi:hypothetical protein
VASGRVEDWRGNSPGEPVQGELRFITANDELDSQQRIVQRLIEKVILSPNDFEVRFRPNGIEVLALELQPEPVAGTVEEAVA